jgi:hypothetical protein
VPRIIDAAEAEITVDVLESKPTVYVAGAIALRSDVNRLVVLYRHGFQPFWRHQASKLCRPMLHNNQPSEPGIVEPWAGFVGILL